MKIAVSGKGGTGKTTITSLIVYCLLNDGKKPILVVDADPNSNLPEALGVKKVEKTIGKILDEFLCTKEEIPTGIVKEALLEQKIYEALIEEKGFDLLVMGAGEGSGCYCYPNSVIRNYIDKLSKNYKYVVIDNEAGMEHISRKTNGDLDILLLISDHSIKGIKTCGRLVNLIKNLNIKVENTYLVIDKAEKEINQHILSEIEAQKLKLIGTIPEDKNITEFELSNIPLLNLDSNSPSVLGMKEIIRKLIN